MKTKDRTTVPRRELERLLNLVHPDPHSILGIHPTPEGMAICVLRPDAESVQLIPEGANPLLIPKRHPLRFFYLLL